MLAWMGFNLKSLLWCVFPGHQTIHDGPLTLEDLNKSNRYNTKPLQPPRKEQPGINQALRELKQLESGKTSSFS